jgi:hypothetical protein
MSEIKQLPGFDDVAHIFGKAALNVHPSYAHGFWLGMISGGRNISPKDWVDTVLGRPQAWGSLPTNVQHILLAIAEASVEQLGDPQYSLQLLLPDDDEALDDRLHGVSEWCTGFTQAFRHCNENHQELLQGDAAEALSDLNEIRQISLEIEDGPQDEQNFVEVLEYIRVAVLLIHQDLLSKHNFPPASDATMH